MCLISLSMAKDPTAKLTCNTVPSTARTQERKTEQVPRTPSPCRLTWAVLPQATGHWTQYNVPTGVHRSSLLLNSCAPPGNDGLELVWNLHKPPLGFKWEQRCLSIPKGSVFIGGRVIREVKNLPCCQPLLFAARSNLYQEGVRRSLCSQICFLSP